MKSRTDRSHDAVRRGHSRLTTVSLYALGAGLVGEVPVYDGYVAMDLGRSKGPRYGAIDVPGYEWFQLFDPSTICWVEVVQEIEGESWNLGQWPVDKVEDEHPSGLVRVDLGDWAGRRIRSVAEFQQDMPFPKPTATIATMFQHYMAGVTPGGSYTVTQDDTLGAARPYMPRVSAGGDVYAAMREVAQAADAYLICTTINTGQVRLYDPYQPVHEDLTGTVNRMTRSWDMDEIINRVVVNLRSEDSEGGDFTGRKSIADGPWKFDRDGIGYCILVESVSVPKATQAAANAKANYYYSRRAGAVKQLSLRVVPQPWLEAGDIIFAHVGDATEQGCIESIEYPLRADGAMTIRTRGIPVI